MLTYFPTPYPGEWWYSILCRYHIRSGRRNAEETLKELCVPHKLVHSRLMPSVDCLYVMKKIPPHIFSAEKIYIEHTFVFYKE